MKLQYSGAGHVDKDSGDVVLLCNTPVGERVGVVVEGSCSCFFYLDVPFSWTMGHVRAWTQHLQTCWAWTLSQPIELEKRQQLMGYVPDPLTGDPKQLRYLLFRFRSPRGMQKALKELRRDARSYKNDLVREFLKDNKDLFDYEKHWRPLGKAEMHMTDGRRFPALSKFQSLHGIVPMSWIQVPNVQETEEPPELVRNLSKVVRVHIDKVQRLKDMDEKQLTATRTLLSWDIETTSEYREDEDDTGPILPA